MLTPGKLKELKINKSPQKIIREIKDYILLSKAPINHWAFASFFYKNKYEQFISYYAIWQFNKHTIDSTIIFPTSTWESYYGIQYFLRFTPYQLIKMDILNYPDELYVNYEKLIKLYAKFIDSGNKLLMDYGMYRLNNIKENLTKLIEEEKEIYELTKKYTNNNR